MVYEPAGVTALLLSKRPKPLSPVTGARSKEPVLAVGFEPPASVLIKFIVQQLLATVVNDCAKLDPDAAVLFTVESVPVPQPVYDAYAKP